MLAEVGLQGEDGLILIHIENQAQFQPDFAKRMFIYFSRLYQKFQRRILPIAVFSYDTPHDEADYLEIEFPFLDVMRFIDDTMIKFNNSWDEYLKDEFAKPYYRQLRIFLKDEYTHHTVYPNMYDLFSAFKVTSYEAVKVVILGQDPYHEEGQAHGMAFSVKPGVAVPPYAAWLKNWCYTDCDTHSLPMCLTCLTILLIDPFFPKSYLNLWILKRPMCW